MVAELAATQTLPQCIRGALTPSRQDVYLERVDAAWTPLSSDQLIARVENVACAIRESGLKQGDRVALIAHNCVDWIVADFGTLFAGCVVVPIFPTQAVDYTTYILEHSGAALIFTDTQATLARVRAGGGHIPKTIVFDATGDDSLAAFEERGRIARVQRPQLPGAYESALHPDDLAVLIYTSGTTGNPKGVMLSHDNVSFDARSALAYGLNKLEAGNPVLTVLPFSHIYEHTILYVYLLAAVRCFVCHDPNALLSDLLDARPTVMTAVPRIFDRMLAGIRATAMRAGGLQAALVPWALETGRAYAQARTFEKGASRGLAMRYAVADRVVLRKIRARLGLDRLQFLVSGSAPLHVDTAMTFLGLGLPIMQGYGLTETSPVITSSRDDANSYGASGRAIPGVEISIDPDGEILTRGRHVMRGYFQDPPATAAAIVDGWFHTGDIGQIDANGFLHIVDRKGEQFKTDTGKWISPSRIEAALKRSAFVSQAMVVGSGRPHPAALLCPNWELLKLQLPLPASESSERLAGRPDVGEFMANVAREQTAQLASHEQIRRTIVVPVEFSVEAGDLSPSMKIKRRVVERRYASDIDRAYLTDVRSHSAA